MIDICFNCTHASFENDMEDILSRAQTAGVKHMIVPGSSAEDSEQAINLMQLYPQFLSATVGIHPHLAHTWQDNTVKCLHKMLQIDGVVASGETGLDYYRNYSRPQDQQYAFEEQIQLATKHKLPMFLHERDAHKDFLAILAPYRDQLSNAVVHCFTGNKKSVFNYLDLDLHIGITGWICDERRGEELRKIVHHIPLERLMIETDAPYLIPRDLPHHIKGNRNEPAFLAHIAEQVARYMNINTEKLKQHSSNNAERFFKLSNLSALKDK